MQGTRFTLGQGAMPVLRAVHSGTVPGPAPEEAVLAVLQGSGPLPYTPFQAEVIRALMQLSTEQKEEGKRES